MMMRVFLVLAVLAITPFFTGDIVHARTETIAAVVNDEAITISDVNQRMRLIIISSGLANTQEIRQRLTPQVISALVEEQLKLQEANRLDINVTPSEIAQGFATIAQQNNMSAEQFRNVIQQSQINVATMERQIESQIAWTKVIQSQLRPQVVVSETDIDAYMERVMVNKGKSEYLVSEIFLPVDDPKNENDARQLANRLVGQVRGKGAGAFFKVAQQFSQAAGAPQGGNLGWVQDGQLPEELDRALVSLGKGAVSGPVRSLSGYHIIMLRDKRAITAENLPSRDQIMNNLGVQRMERLQRRHLLDLKAAAFIENRFES